MEIPGYGCEDHFLENDTYLHCWESLGKLLDSDLTDDILCDFGMPVIHRNVRYNCRIFVLNRKILLIRPKLILADDGNYREPRWFSAWKDRYMTESHYLPRFIRKITGQSTVPIGEACIALRDTIVGAESCEELYAPDSPHIQLALSGVEIIGNGSGSHHQLRKLNHRVDLVKSATTKSGGIYLYSNQQCCDGGRLYYDGCAMISCNGNVIAQGTQFSVKEVEVVVATADLEAVRNFRGSIKSRCEQATLAKKVPRINVEFDLTNPTYPSSRIARAVLSKSMDVKYHLPEEEIGFGPACWLWDYLRRSRTNGYLLPLSGGADSSSVAAIVGIMCDFVFKAVQEGDRHVIEDVRRVARYGEDELPTSARELCSRIFFTFYLGSKNSSDETRNRAQRLAEEVGATHHSVNIDKVTETFESMAFDVFDKKPQFKLHGGSETENLALQNIQARSRMVLSYMFAQLSLWAIGKPGALLVLGAANVDEALRGYLTKYDCSSADINPIGGVSKNDLKKFLIWCGKAYNWPSLLEVEAAPPTAELEPISSNYRQTDEEDMGMSYDDLAMFGRLRKIEKCGPVSMFQKILAERQDWSPKTVAEKVKRFFYYYSVNRHKMTTLTPSYHAESYGPDDNRFDLRPFLYNTRWTWQFDTIDRLAEDLELSEKEGKSLTTDMSIDY